MWCGMRFGSGCGRRWPGWMRGRPWWFPSPIRSLMPGRGQGRGTLPVGGVGSGGGCRSPGDRWGVTCSSSGGMRGSARNACPVPIGTRAMSGSDSCSRSAGPTRGRIRLVAGARRTTRCCSASTRSTASRTSALSLFAYWTRNRRTSAGLGGRIRRWGRVEGGGGGLSTVPGSPWWRADVSPSRSGGVKCYTQGVAYAAGRSTRPLWSPASPCRHAGTARQNWSSKRRLGLVRADRYRPERWTLCGRAALPMRG